MNKYGYTPTAAECGCYCGSTSDPQGECFCYGFDVSNTNIVEIKTPPSNSKYDPFNARAMWKKPRRGRYPANYAGHSDRN